MEKEDAYMPVHAHSLMDLYKGQSSEIPTNVLLLIDSFSGNKVPWVILKQSQLSY